MSFYRNVYLGFWDDPKIKDRFTPEDKYFYLYLITNAHTNICGCYEISIAQTALDTGYNMDTVNKLLNRLDTVHNVIRYSSEFGEVLILHWYKYNWSRSEKVRIAIKRVSEHIKNKEYQSYVLKMLYALPDLIKESNKENITDTDTYTYTDTDKSVYTDISIGNAYDMDTISSDDDCPAKRGTNTSLILEKWNQLADCGIKPIQSLNSGTKRYDSISARVRSYGIDKVLGAIERVRKSKFLRGENKSGWMITFDWFVCPNNFIKVMEGNYDDEEQKAGSSDVNSLFEEMSDETGRS